jgi:hypothetical protein
VDNAEVLAQLEADTMLLKASEDWGESYSEDVQTHAQLIKHETALELILRRYFRNMAEKAETFIHWDHYHNAIHAYDVEVLVYDDGIDEYNGIFMQVTFDEVAAMVAIGAQAGEAIYTRPIGMVSSTDVIQKTARTQVAELVGKRVLPDGSVIDNPNAKYRITDKIRDDIKQSIQSSIALGENRTDAIERMRKTIRNARRAETIARTESVNAYSRGLLEFGKQSGAIGKVWQTVGAGDICATYAALGPVPIKHSYDGKNGPTAHPHCRCGLRLIYQNELDENPDLFAQT